ncbi:MAG: tRNA dihydrouridine synthase DusB [Ignavibacteria bacterium]|jgi:tRNA-dihydrouridine synthase B
MKVGRLDIGDKLILAPMADVTDAPFRIIAKEHGAGLTFTQMVSAKGILTNEFYTLRKLAFSRSEKPIGVQLLGKGPELLYGAVKELHRFQPDVIDLNCGCPVEQVTKYEMGSAIMDNPELLGKLVASMVKGSEGIIPVSVKIRLGKNRNTINIIDNAKIIEDNGASLIILHARARVDRYETNPLWEWIAKVKDTVSIPVVGNGSVFKPEDAVKLLSFTGCDSIMVARGALGNPFLFERYNAVKKGMNDSGLPEVSKVTEVCTKHIKLLNVEYGEFNSLDKIKKNVIWYFRNYNGITCLIEKLLSLKSFKEIKNLIENHSQKIKKGEYPEENLEQIFKKFNNKVVFWQAEEKELVA